MTIQPTAPARRTLRPGGPAARGELAALLTAVWAAEAIRPSRFLLMAVPELADATALDNRAGGYSGLEPSWGERTVRVSDMLIRTLEHGGEAWVFVRRRDDGPNLLLERLHRRAAEIGRVDRLRSAEPDALPAAGLFGDGYALAGAVAFADEGPDFAGEGLAFELDPDDARRAQLRPTFEDLLR